MFKIGEYVLDKNTNQKGVIFNKQKKFYLVKFNEGFIEGKFEWELEKYSLIKKIIGGIKNGRKQRKCSGNT